MTSHFLFAPFEFSINTRAFFNWNLVINMFIKCTRRESDMRTGITKQNDLHFDSNK